MSKRTWVIIGATSIIAKEFAQIAAGEGHTLVLVGRNQVQLERIATDITLRYHVHCDVILADFTQSIEALILFINHLKSIDLFIAQTLQVDNNKLSQGTIVDLVNVNITSTLQLIHSYWHKKQKEHHLVFLSSMAAVRGRAKNSLYGASKACIETYLEGLMQSATPEQHITIARLGFIDTHQTFNEPGIFYASPPAACAKACWRGIRLKKRWIYHPFFWRYIALIIIHLPFVLFKKIRA